MQPEEPVSPRAAFPDPATGAGERSVVRATAQISAITFVARLAGFARWVLLGYAVGTTFLGNHPFKPLSRLGKSAIEEFTTIAPTSTPLQVEKSEATENLVIGSFLDKENAFEVLIKFLRTIGDTKVLSNPKLAVVNNEEAKIHVGEREAYVTTTTTTGQATSATAESVTFVDVGIQLSVTPTINEDGFVTMKIKPEVSSVARSLITPSGNAIPIIDTSEAETTVMVKDGKTIIIAGLRKDEQNDTNQRVPFLGDIPLIGRLFQNVVTSKKRTELLVLLTPHIIDGSRLISGEPRSPSQAMKSYEDYSSMVTKGGARPEEPKEPSFFGNFFRKLFFLSHE